MGNKENGGVALRRRQQRSVVLVTLDKHVEWSLGTHCLQSTCKAGYLPKGRSALEKSGEEKGGGKRASDRREAQSVNRGTSRGGHHNT